MGIIKSALLKALSATLLFLLAFLFYNSEIVRSSMEDIAFDVVNKLAINSNPVETNSSQILLFAIDDLYMIEQGLYDEENRSKYGYLFPRDKIAKLIENFDQFVSEIDQKNIPKALFIDYDMSFSSLPYGKALSYEDKVLMEVLERKRSYTIFLPKTDVYNFIQKSQSKKIQRAIEEKRIRFFSVSLLKSGDGDTRRYLGYKSYTEVNASKEYLNVDIALWQMLRGERIDLDAAKKIFSEKDIVANRIWIKAYESYQQEEQCSVQQSYWKRLTKYSANCSLYEIIEEEFSGAVVMLGGTHSQNDDLFDVLDVMGPESLSGLDMHANALMTMIHLGGAMKRVPIFQSGMIVFICFFIVSVAVSRGFLYLKKDNSEVEFIVLLMLVTAILIIISVYLLQTYQLWFNWFVPLVLFEIVEIFDYIKDFTPKIIATMRRKR
jgi:CHASE2 domain-containing sensor protein